MGKMKGADDEMFPREEGGGAPIDPVLEEIGYRLKRVREEAGITQRDLGLAAGGVSTGYIYLLERGRQNMSLLIFLRLAAALKVSVTELLPDEDIMVDPPSERIFGRLLATEERLKQVIEARRRQDEAIVQDMQKLAAASQSIAESIKKMENKKEKGGEGEMLPTPARKARPRRSSSTPPRKKR